jgi:hypothetical protein
MRYHCGICNTGAEEHQSTILRYGLCVRCHEARELEIRRTAISAPPTIIVPNDVALDSEWLRPMVIKETIQPRQSRIEDALDWD